MLSHILLSQQLAQSASDNLAASQRVAQLAVLPLEARLDQLELACAGLWELLQDKFQLTEAELVAKMEEVDLRDGKRDHKMGAIRMICPHCNRPLATKSRVRCVYCGQDLPQSGLGGTASQP